jgi:hypothetical protein
MISYTFSLTGGGTTWGSSFGGYSVSDFIVASSVTTGLVAGLPENKVPCFFSSLLLATGKAGGLTVVFGITAEIEGGGLAITWGT